MDTKIYTQKIGKIQQDYLTCKEQWRGPTMKLTMTLSGRTPVGQAQEVESLPIEVANKARVRFLFKMVGEFHMEPYISFIKHEDAGSSMVRINICCTEYVVFEKQGLCTDDWIEYLDMFTFIRCDENILKLQDQVNAPVCTYHFAVFITLYDDGAESPYNKLYEDTKMTDFYLKASDGAVAVHKMMLGLQSDVFRTMLAGQWKETAEGSVSIAEGTVNTLQYFKDFMYLRTLPEDQLELQQLLLIARRYLVNDLEAKCIQQLVKIVTPENFDGLVEFACDKNIPELVKAIVLETPGHIVNRLRQVTTDKHVSNEETKT